LDVREMVHFEFLASIRIKLNQMVGRESNSTRLRPVLPFFSAHIFCASRDCPACSSVISYKCTIVVSVAVFCRMQHALSGENP